MNLVPRVAGAAWRRLQSQFPVVLLTGPRQVGKTTLLRALCEPERSYVSLDDLLARELATEDPELFFQQYPPPVLIDEVQYVPALLTAIKRRVDADRAPGAFWLTGSQPFHLMQGLSETLAGRIGLLNLLGFSTREALGTDDLDDPFLPLPERMEPRAETAWISDRSAVFDRIWRGSMPALLTGEISDRDAFYSAYVSTYLERDVRQLTQVGDLLSFRRFVAAAAARTGQLLNLSDLAKDTDVSVPTARSWLSVLAASWQVYLLQPLHSNVTKRLTKTPKLYFLDTGLCAWLTRWSSPDALAAGAMAGPILESFVVGEILRSWWHRGQTPAVWFYRDHDGREIDLVFERDGCLLPVEVKSAATVRRQWARGLASVDRLGKRGPGAVLCLTEQTAALDRLSVAAPIGLL